ncbi:MAG: histidine kinase, partial [Selenomonadaceae bacterium]
MKNAENGDKTLDYILKNTVQTIENSKSQIFDIYESARAEVDGNKENLTKIKQETEKIIRVVDELEKIEQQEKRKLVLVSGNFTNYSEERIKATYESVKNIQVKLGIAREKEHQLRTQRNKIELQMKNLKGTLGKAERLAMRISSVLGYLSSHISDVVAQMQNASKSKFIGAQIIKAQEDERLRVSREIHDGPAQGMAQLIYQATICERMIDINKEEAKWNLQQLRHQIRG